MGVRLFVGNLSYATTEADLRSYFGAVAPPAQVVVPVDRETGRPRGFAFVEFSDRSHAEQAIQRFNGQVFNGRPLAVSEARAREDRGPGGPRPGGGFSGPRPGGFSDLDRQDQGPASADPGPPAASAVPGRSIPVPRRLRPRAAAISVPTPSRRAAVKKGARRRSPSGPAVPFR